MSVLIICGSKSDVGTIRKAADLLREKKVKCVVRVCSAHRTPEMLDKILASADFDEKDKCSAIIAGAGLAAALPGVVASKTTLPVIGVPLSGAFEGIDALLSIAQMPPGIPVICTGVNNTTDAAEIAFKISNFHSGKVRIVATKKGKAIAKAEEMLSHFGIGFCHGEKTDKDFLNLVFVGLDEKTIPKSEGLAIFCPVAENEKAADVLRLQHIMEKGGWVGLNRGENAAVAAAEIMGLSAKLKEYRSEMKIKVEEYDKEVNK
jgi:5-(carboxyamino)imidazole ribonucleotide mutase